MKLVIAIIWVTTLNVFSDEKSLNDDARTRIVNIAKQIEFVDDHRTELQELQSLIDKSTKLSDKKMLRYNELSKAKSLSHKSVIDLHTLLKEGNSVLDYPGLLSFGQIRYDGNSYCMMVDAGSKYGEPATVAITFDNSGKILSVMRIMVEK